MFVALAPEETTALGIAASTYKRKQGASASGGRQRAETIAPIDLRPGRPYIRQDASYDAAQFGNRKSRLRSCQKPPVRRNFHSRGARLAAQRWLALDLERWVGRPVEAANIHEATLIT